MQLNIALHIYISFVSQQQIYLYINIVTLIHMCILLSNVYLEHRSHIYKYNHAYIHIHLQKGGYRCIDRKNNVGMYVYIHIYTDIQRCTCIERYMRHVYLYVERGVYVQKEILICKCAESDLLMHDKGMYMCRAKVMCIERYVYMFLGTCICIQSLLYMDMWVRCISIQLYPQATIYIYIQTHTPPVRINLSEYVA